MRRDALLVSALLVSACVTPSKVFLSTWEPATLEYQQGLPRLVSEALVVRDSEIEALIAAGGTLIGYQNAEKGWARRVASVGGSHFLPVERSSHTRVGCFPAFGAVLCRSGEHTDWMRVAVIRVEPTRWHELPPHMIPPQSIAMPGVRATAWRTNCKVHNTRGTVRCRDSWRVVTGAEVVAADVAGRD